MKRRDFLLTSVGVTGAMLPLASRALSAPCPPGTLTVSGGTTVQTPCVPPGDAEADWIARSTGPGVVWAHDFRYRDELYKFIKVTGDYTVDYPENLLPHLRAGGVTGGYYLEYTNIGTTIAKDISATATQIELTDASDFPDPQGGKYPYRLALQQEKLVDKAGTGRENVTVMAKNGNVLTVVRATNKSTQSVAWPAGTTIGWDCEGQWARPMSAFPRGINGLPQDDAAVRGTLPLRSLNVKPGEQAGPAIWNFQEGYWGHRDYHAKYPTWAGTSNPWDGEDFYIQFRVRIDSRRFAAGNIGDGKLFFLHSSAGGATQLVGTMSAKNRTSVRTSRFGMFTNYGNGPSGQSLLTNPQAGGRGAELQPSSPFTGCTVGAAPADCWEWPVDEWVTVLLHVKPGHHNDNKYGLGASGPAPAGSIVVDTSAFKPVNDGTSLEFETNLVPQPDAYDFPGRLDNRADDYFRNWGVVFPSGPLKAAGNNAFRVDSYTVTGGRARWRLVVMDSREALPAGVPANGDEFGVQWGDLVSSAKYKDTTIDAWVARNSEKEYTQLFRKSDFAYLFGDEGVGVFGRHPPAFNVFQPTSYQNVQDGMIPPQRTYSYGFDQVILSKQFIPCPQV